ncbi:MAG: FtsH protease activity modulator HflK [archaeon]|nr:FtsH protease activity modulator HflK [archaeon]
MSQENSYANLEQTKIFNRAKKIAKFSLLGLTLAIGAFTSFYIVPNNSKAVVQRFGEYVRTENPGLHVKIPFGIEKKTTIPVTTIMTQEFGFRSEGGNQFKGDTKDLQNEYIMLTGDLNIADVESSVQYQIENPVSYLFSVKNPEELLRIAHASHVRELIGNGSIDEAMNMKRTEYTIKARDMLQKSMQDYHTGLSIRNVIFQSVNPPKNVRSSFNAVNKAIQDKETAINNAKKEYNSIVPQAQGTAQQLIAQAEAYRLQRVNGARAEVAQFSQTYEAYLKNPAITRQRIYFEAMTDLLPKMKEKWIIEQRGLESGLLMKLDIDQRSIGGTAK